jgi:hypothetical protein
MRLNLAVFEMLCTPPFHSHLISYIIWSFRIFVSHSFLLSMFTSLGSNIQYILNEMLHCSSLQSKPHISRKLIHVYKFHRCSVRLEEERRNRPQSVKKLAARCVTSLSALPWRIVINRNRSVHHMVRYFYLISLRHGFLIGSKSARGPENTCTILRSYNFRHLTRFDIRNSTDWPTLTSYARGYT